DRVRPMPIRLRVVPTPIPGAAPSGGAPPAERAVEFADGVTEIRVGRRPDLELPLPDRALSALHARFVKVDDRWQVEDLGSTNGTRVDGQRLAPGTPRAVAPGAQVVVGQITFVFDGPVAPVVGAEGTATIARRLVGDLFAASPAMATPTLAVVGGVRAGAPLRLETLERRYLLGRAETCDLQLVSEEVSREHAEVVRLWDRVVVRDLGSKNGVRVNDAVVTDRRRLRDGDRIQIGPALLRLSDPTDRYLRDFEAHTEEQEDAEAEPPTATEPFDPAAAPVPAAAGAAEVAPPATGRLGGSRTAIAVAGAVLLIVGAVIAALAFGR
ncbi:MAG TPA: FHA domain-containing protein, partial [Polyangia bacterium]|nr:FHA domain-containing protein [Polyangia bacterium]